MKGLIKKIALCLLAFVAVFGLAACEENKPEVETPEQVAAAKESALEELAVAIDSVDKAEYSQDVLDVIAQIKAYGELFIGNSTTVASVANSLSTILTHFEEYLGAQIPLANGAYSYVASSYEARTEILGILEAYAVKAGLTGITVFEDSGFVMYHESVKKGTESYIPGYGFGVITEGELTADLDGEANAAWKRYYHTYEAEDPKTLNYGDDKGSVVGGLVGYIMGSYWGTKMNDTKDGYEWYSDLASEKPQPQNANPETGLATIYKFEIKTGEELKYNTLSTKFADYKGREVVKEDYLTPWKLLYTQANGWARGTENHEGAAAVKGIAQYYNASADGFNAEAWENVGVKVSTENGKDYMTIEFVTPCTPFYAMYYAASSLYAPIPEEFINEDGIGAANYGKFNVAAGLTPVDTTLSTGPYVVEQWDQEQQIVFKKNELYCNADLGLYKIAGIHFNILSASTSDPEAGLKEFLANKIHATGIPSTKLDEYKNDPRTLQTVGETTTKLNVNTCTQEEWEKLFGVDGTITRTERANYWECEPALSNEDFVLGLSYAINRNEFATEKGKTPSVSYFGAGYMSDPEKGISYNSTQAHADAIAQLIEGTDGYGYSLEKARTAFDKAARALLASGAYQAGDTIELEIAWQSPANVTVYHNAIKNYWETAFNHESVADGKLKLEVVDYVPATWSDVYYKKMMVGQYDIGFGGISGNPLNPINFLEVLKSDNSSGFTLNWGPDTNVVSTDLVWEGRAWSFDTLWKVADTGGYVESGVIVPVIDPELKTGLTMNEDGTSTYEINANIITADKVEVAVDKMVIFGYDSTGTYMEDAVSFEIVDGVIKVTVNAELTAKYAAALPEDGHMGIDVYFTTTICGVPSSGYATVYTSVVPAPAE